MTARAARRLPGVQFESRPPAVADALPRMDVAAFVGFASSGPIDTPVPLEDAETFADLFGGDPVLAWDRERCEPVRAKLGAAVRGFFRNGGRRCWVVRVAGADAAANYFPVPGLLRLDAGGALRPVFLTARSPGSWSDGLEVGAATVRAPVGISSLELEGATPRRARLEAPDAVMLGDLVELSWPDGTRLVTAVASVDGEIARFAGSGATVWLRGAPTSPGEWSASWEQRHDGVAAPLPPLVSAPAWQDDGTARVIFGGDAPVAPGRPVLLSRGDEQVWLWVTTSRAVELPASPPLRGTVVDGRWTRPSPQAPLAPPPDGLPAGERVRLELWARPAGGHPRRLSELGLAPGQPRYLGALPTDVELFAVDEPPLSVGEQTLRERLRALVGDGAEVASYHESLWREVANPRFGLAVDEGQGDLFLPLGLSVLPESFLGPEPVALGAAARDGLAVFEAVSFLDPALADQSTRSLAAQADYVRWQQPWPRRLRGLHALWNLDEPTLVAVPDAIHRGWGAEEDEAPPQLATPLLSAAPDAGRWQLHWTAVDPDASYVLEQAETADFSRPIARRLGAGVLRFEVDPAAPSRLWFRVRAWPPRADVATTSFWSDPVEVVTPPPQFGDCQPAALGTPSLTVEAPPGSTGTFRLSWTAVADASRYLVEVSDGLDFGDVRRVFVGAERQLTLYGLGPGRSHYRVRAELAPSETTIDSEWGCASSMVGSWSNGVAVLVPTPPRRVLLPTAAFDPAALLAVQAGLLRLAAARGDLLAVLGVPEHYREDETLRHVSALRGVVAEREAWSFAALYHPWLLLEGNDGVVRVPPDGPMSGVIAARAASRGAWLAPANQPLLDVLGLSPDLGRGPQQRLFEGQINVLAQEPHGFVALNADTIALDPDLVPIGVRRLLSLLRRLALRLGPTFTFEPNSAAFRRAVERAFVGLLDGMYRAGAFTGARPAEAYQVVVDASVNTDASLDQGRFIVELKVAPSLPLNFLTVRLVQDGARGRVTEAG